MMDASHEEVIGGRPSQTDAEKLEEIRQRWEKATPGPWRTWDNNNRTFIDDGSPFHCVAKIATGWADHGDANAQAIAAAPMDIAWLITLASRAVELERKPIPTTKHSFDISDEVYDELDMSNG